MSAILDKYEVIKAEAIAAEGWFEIHKHWLMACAVCGAIGAFIGWSIP